MRRASLAAVVVLPDPCSPTSRRPAHQRGQFAVHDTDQRLAGRQRSGDLRADGLFPDPVDEVPDHRQRDVGFEQREPHFAQRVLDVVIGEPGLPAQLLDDAGKSLCEIVEHGDSVSVQAHGVNAAAG